ncbi:hypothetical protein GCK72_026105 [Caenorhabditis remanei]|uniref:Cadherin domain-containing protein n=1 Tax=Caenorhabditis remanei TaxID=31234 RepID=A0A6A5G3X8_CAERE|nr:hypothetical protein GCK72_026105 [Caenorhabditis remanei]KAF1749637.1 hypothetical protein GCK72_026105 [Caenorhabditis remanei]
MAIGSLIAEHLDEGENGVVTESLHSGNTSLIAVHSTIGESIRCSVVASDGQKSRKVPVEILLKDINNNSPQILNQNLDVYIPDDVTPSEVIHVIH